MMRRSNRRLRLCAALLTCNLLFIWGNSLLPGEASAAFSQWVQDLLTALFPGEPSQELGSGLLRKLAHFTEFACLGMLLAWLQGMLTVKNRFLALPALAWAFGAACVDEAIQCFVPERGPSLWDVGLDTCGAAVGILLLMAGYHIRKKNNQFLEETK